METRFIVDVFFNAVSETWDGQAPIFRQVSADGSLGELGGLWLQEDNMIIVM